MRIERMQISWPGRFNAGNAVVHGDRLGHVVAVTPGIVSQGCVPVMHDDEENGFVAVPVDDLARRFGSVSSEQ